jgi:uncharacterized protein YjbI with pentapeptide repeats
MTVDIDRRNVWQLHAQIKDLSRIILKAQRYAESDPEVSLAQARKSAEAICRLVFAAEIGDPGATITLAELIRRLKEARILPIKVLVPLGTIQAYGNYGAHPQGDIGEIEPEFVAPCLAALDQVTSWYFNVYLRIELPAELARPTPLAEESAPPDSHDTVQLPPSYEADPRSSVTDRGREYKSRDLVHDGPSEVVGEQFAWQELGGREGSKRISNQKWIGCSFRKGARITNVIFEDCELPGLSLTGCFLENVLFERCKMPGTIMIGCVLASARFEQCTLVSAAFLDSIFAERIEFCGELPMLGEGELGREKMNDMTGVEFTRCTMRHGSSMRFRQCLLRFARIARITMDGGNRVDFEKCDMMNAWVEDAGMPSVGVDQYCRTIGLLSFAQPPAGWLDRRPS